MKTLSPWLPAAACLSILLGGCSSVKVWPFGDKESATPGMPANAVEYRCDGGKRFFVRHNGNNVWLILPEREINMSKAAGDAKYVAGNTTLQLEADQAVLSENSNILYSGCKSTPAKK